VGKGEEECGPAAIPRALPPPLVYAVFNFLFNLASIERSAVKFGMLGRRAVW